MKQQDTLEVCLRFSFVGQIALLVACKKRGIPVLCACGAGAKADPSRVRIADLSEASCDPLARKVRYRLRHEHGIVNNLPMILSAEKPRCALINVKDLTNDPYDLQVCATLFFSLSSDAVLCSSDIASFLMLLLLFWLKLCLIFLFLH